VQRRVTPQRDADDSISRKPCLPYRRGVTGNSFDDTSRGPTVDSATLCAYLSLDPPMVLNAILNISLPATGTKSWPFRFGISKRNVTSRLVLRKRASRPMRRHVSSVEIKWKQWRESKSLALESRRPPPPRVLTRINIEGCRGVVGPSRSSCSSGLRRVSPTCSRRSGLFRKSRLT